jgi:hypothetical protein
MKSRFLAVGIASVLFTLGCSEHHSEPVGVIEPPPPATVQSVVAPETPGQPTPSTPPATPTPVSPAKPAPAAAVTPAPAAPPAALAVPATPFDGARKSINAFINSIEEQEKRTKENISGTEAKISSSLATLQEFETEFKKVPSKDENLQPIEDRQATVLAKLSSLDTAMFAKYQNQLRELGANSPFSKIRVQASGLVQRFNGHPNGTGDTIASLENNKRNYQSKLTDLAEEKLIEKQRAVTVTELEAKHRSNVAIYANDVPKDREKWNSFVKESASVVATLEAEESKEVQKPATAAKLAEYETALKKILNTAFDSSSHWQNNIGQTSRATMAQAMLKRPIFIAIANYNLVPRKQFSSAKSYMQELNASVRNQNLDLPDLELLFSAGDELLGKENLTVGFYSPKFDYWAESRRQLYDWGTPDFDINEDLGEALDAFGKKLMAEPNLKALYEIRTQLAQIAFLKSKTKTYLDTLQDILAGGKIKNYSYEDQNKVLTRTRNQYAEFYYILKAAESNIESMEKLREQWYAASLGPSA